MQSELWCALNHRPTSIIILMKNEYNSVEFHSRFRLNLFWSSSAALAVLKGCGCDGEKMSREEWNAGLWISIGMSSSPVHPQSRIHQRTTAVLIRIHVYCFVALWLKVSCFCFEIWVKQKQTTATFLMINSMCGFAKTLNIPSLIKLLFYLWLSVSVFVVVSLLFLYCNYTYYYLYYPRSCMA